MFTVLFGPFKSAVISMRPRPNCRSNSLGRSIVDDMCITNASNFILFSILSASYCFALVALAFTIAHTHTHTITRRNSSP